MSANTATYDTVAGRSLAADESGGFLVPEQNSIDGPTYQGVQETSEPSTEPSRPVAFADVFREHGPYLWRVLVSLGVPESDVEDLCQEVFIVVHRRLGTFDGRSLRGWLYGICLKVAANYRRSARVRCEIIAEPPEPSAPATQPQSVEAGRLQAKLLGVLDRLDADKRAAFVLYEIEQLTLVEIAEATDAPLQTVHSRIKAAREIVRRAFEANHEGHARRLSEAG